MGTTVVAVSDDGGPHANAKLLGALEDGATREMLQGGGVMLMSDLPQVAIPNENVLLPHDALRGRRATSLGMPVEAEPSWRA